MNSISRQPISALDRQRSLRTRVGNFEEWTNLRSRVHGIRTSLRQPDLGRRP